MGAYRISILVEKIFSVSYKYNKIYLIFKDLSDIGVLTNAQSSNKVFFPNLNGLRFFCFLSVFFAHSFVTKNMVILQSSTYSFFKNFLFRYSGDLGVSFFFVLSGFLITYLLLAEKKRFATISISNFYKRRILRIWPLYYLCVIFGFFVYPHFKILLGQQPHELARLPMYIFFAANLDRLTHPPESTTLGILWSIAIEEQFYLFWPIVVYLIPHRSLLYLFTAILFGSFLFRYIYSSPQEGFIRIYHTFSCISDLTMGGIFAVIAIEGKRLKNTIIEAPKWVWLLLYALIILIYLYAGDIFCYNAITIASSRLVISLLFALVIMEQCYAKNSLYKMANSKILSKLGTYTFGMYCLHTLCIMCSQQILSKTGINNNIVGLLLIESSLSLLLTILFAFTSYYLFERHFLKLKEKFARITT